MIQVEGLLKQYSGRVLFSGLDWHIGGDARVGLVGPNGAGKTTLLRILAGEESADEGTVHRPRIVTVGYLPQEAVAPAGGTVLAQVLGANAEACRIEEELEGLERAMSSAPAGGQGPLLARYGELRHRYEALGGYDLEAEAKRILGGLGFGESDFHAALDTLSGGFRMRVALARLLLARPALLLLDEPTNHLDIESLAWLEEFMQGYPGAIVVVSHDRFFLNRVAGEIAEIDEGRFALYPGDYDDYLEIRQLRRDQEEAAAKQQARRVAEIERFIERFRAKNTKARQVQSRIKMLGRMERIHLRRDQKKIHFSFPAPPRGGAMAVEVRGLVKRFGEKTVYDGADFVARRGDRIALMGPNGAGKTTLMRVLAGALPLDAGERRQGHNVSLAYYAQHQLDALDPARTVLEEVAGAAPDDLRPRVRGLLGMFLFSGDDVDKKIAVLSGGEMARVALCKILLRPANLLLLDEPTNHLDLRSREVLEEALEEYTGTIVFISHDRYFINRIASKVCEVREGRLEIHLGGTEDTLTRATGEAPSPLPPAWGGEGEGEPRGGGPEGSSPERLAWQERRQAVKREEAERRRRERALRSFQARLRAVEEEIARQEALLNEIIARQADPDVYRDGEKARETAHERTEAEGRLAALYDQWEEVSTSIEETAGSAGDANPPAEQERP